MSHLHREFMLSKKAYRQVVNDSNDVSKPLLRTIHL